MVRGLCRPCACPQAPHSSNLGACIGDDKVSARRCRLPPSICPGWERHGRTGNAGTRSLQCDSPTLPQHSHPTCLDTMLASRALNLANRVSRHSARGNLCVRAMVRFSCKASFSYSTTWDGSLSVCSTFTGRPRTALAEVLHHPAHVALPPRAPRYNSRPWLCHLAAGVGGTCSGQGTRAYCVVPVLYSERAWPGAALSWP